MDDLGPILFAHAAQAWANIGHALGNALGDDNIGPGSDRVRKQYWAKFGATRDFSEYGNLGKLLPSGEKYCWYHQFNQHTSQMKL